MSTTNQDLIWQIGGFDYPENVVNFLKRFEDSFCVFSPSVSQLYSNYTLHRVSSCSRTVITLPNPQAHHDTFFNIPSEAILPTNMFILPREVESKKGWLLAYKFKNEKKWNSLPLHVGLKKFRNLYGLKDPLLPVILNNDLRKSSKDCKPLMHLHRISLPKLEGLSELQRRDILNVIDEKIEEFFAA